MVLKRCVFVVAIFAILFLFHVEGRALALQQVAGKIEVHVKAGESKTFEWRLISDSDQDTEISLRVEGAGGEFVSLPKAVPMGPKQSVSVIANVTIPLEHPGNVTLHPVAYATQSGKPGGPTIINLQMQKTLSIFIEPNLNAHVATGGGRSIQSFVSQVTIAGSKVPFSIYSNSEISDFAFDERSKRISFNVASPVGVNSFAIVPVGRLLVEPYAVMVDGTPILNYETIANVSSVDTNLKINYDHNAHTILLKGTSVVPEFSIPAVIAAIGVVAVIANQTIRRKLIDVWP